MAPFLLSVMADSNSSHISTRSLPLPPPSSTLFFAVVTSLLSPRPSYISLLFCRSFINILSSAALSPSTKDPRSLNPSIALDVIWERSPARRLKVRCLPNAAYISTTTLQLDSSLNYRLMNSINRRIVRLRRYRDSCLWFLTIR
jgi:hypothetical protein